MSSEARLRRLPKFLPAMVLVGVVALGLGAAYSFASVDSFPVTWSVRPLNIKFSLSSATSGSANDSFTCSPSFSTVTLQAFSNFPNNITLTVSPPSFPSCGSTPDTVKVTASCTAAALANNTCDGDRYTGTVVVCAAAPYACLKEVLAVNIAVTSHP